DACMLRLVDHINLQPAGAEPHQPQQQTLLPMEALQSSLLRNSNSNSSSSNSSSSSKQARMHELVGFERLSSYEKHHICMRCPASSVHACIYACICVYVCMQGEG